MIRRAFTSSESSGLCRKFSHTVTTPFELAQKALLHAKKKMLCSFEFLNKSDIGFAVMVGRETLVLGLPCLLTLMV
jgi:hypothetical protein